MADDGEVKLFGTWASPFAFRVELALKLKGVPYEYIQEDLTDKSSDLLKYNPVYKKVPVLVHRGRPIAESQVILEYIDETWKTDYPLLPQDPYERAMARFWARFIDEKFLSTSWQAACSSSEAEREKLIEEALGYLKVLEEQQHKRLLGGNDTIGFLEICSSFVAYWIIVIQEAAGVDLLTESKFPNLWKWAVEFQGCPAIKQKLPLPEKDRLVAFFSAMIEKIKRYK
ncbi:hypothetical protein SAY86_022208 [Trapa natans]|uniref:Glutathione S-transferase n=1 Tax=Trapa natans TaxID=22666 RepID=A0AAN7RKW9_TRANT|nr:hypothetical protein SAY86_022208 [Trapa natans]